MDDTWLPTAIHCVDPHNRPVIFPCNRLHMDDSSVKSSVLKMNEPFISIHCIHQSPLMWSIYDTVALMKHIFFFIRPVNIFRTQNNLPAGFYTACRGKNIIISILFIYFRSLNRRLCLKSTVENMILPCCLCSIP